MNLIYFNQQNKTPPKLELIGSKGHSLVNLSHKKFKVPLFSILTTKFFDSWIEKVKSSVVWKKLLESGKEKSLFYELKSEIKSLSYSDDQKKALKLLKEFVADKKIPLLAVRSSSPDEDLEGASFAGIYETVLGVELSGLEDAIKVCFSSVFSERVADYKKQMGFKITDPKISVIIQKQIASDVSGVAFSLNPITNDYDEAVIDANFGLGESVVDGTITPDHFVVNKVDNSIIEKTLGNKATAVWVESEGGTTSKAPTNQAEFCLTDDQVLEISSLTSLVENEYNKPMDIEWTYEKGVLYLLQARPITGYIKLPPILLTKPGEQKKLYQDGLLTEQGLVESLSPLGTPFFGLMAGMNARDLNFEEVTPMNTTAAGRYYINMGNMAKIMGKKNIIKTINLVDSLGAQILKQIDFSQYIPRKSQKGLLKQIMKVFGAQISFKSILRMKKASSKPNEYLQFYLEENTKLERNLKRIFKNYHIDNSFIDFINDIFPNLLVTWMRDVSLPPLTARMMASSKIKKMFKDEPQSVQDNLIYLEQAFPNNPTIDMGLLLFELSQFTEIQKIENEVRFLDMLNKEQFSKEFMEKWKTFIDRFGFRGPKELDVATKRYSETPQELFSILKNMRNIDSQQSPQEKFKQGKKRREESVELLIDILEKKNKSKVKSFMKNYKVIETFAAYRETPKYYLILGIKYIRQVILRVAKNLVETNRLDNIEQIFYLNLKDFVQSLKNENLDLRKLVSDNIEYLNQFKDNKNIPSLIDSRGRIPRLKRDDIKENEFLGTPISPGIVKGPVKILKHPGEKPIQPGDILVTRATDPGWTTIFLNATGVLLETGGSLQHGASLSRELGKPCIVGLDNIGSILKDGQIVELDGSTGIVKILE